MGDIIEKMGDHSPETFFGFNILLPADMTIFPMHQGAAIETVLFFSLR